MRKKSDQLVTIEKDALFNLLPFAIKTYDNGALKLLFRAVSEQHNFIISKLRELIRLQNPWLAAAFKPEDFGEQSSIYKEYAGLIGRWSSLTDGQRIYTKALENKIPNSIRAGKLENSVLSALASNVGEVTYGGKLRAGLRGLIASAVSRHHIRGSHSSVYALGLVSGVFELAVRELWSRYSLSEPDNPASLKNNDDFAYEPDMYPYFTINGKYSGASVKQYNETYGVYNPRILDDAAGLLYEEVFKWCVPLRTSPYWYNKVVNGKNPFGNFTSDITNKLISGTYRMSGGSDNSRAYTLIPSINGTLNIFEAASYGSWANDVSISIFNNYNGTQDVTVVGPRSKIKFKSSYFDLSVGADISVYPLIYPSIPVIRNSSQSYLDAELGRDIPDYPVTVTRSGALYNKVVSDPSIHFQVDNRQINELFGILKLMFESIRPITRTIRFEHFGILLRDQVQYAPVLTINEVRLQAIDGSVWELVISQDGTISWEANSEGPTRIPTQYERLSKRLIKWTISEDGVFRATPINQADPNNLGESVVYYRSQLYNGFVYSENGILRTSITSPSLLLDTVHSDGTFNEKILSEQYEKYAENPIPGTEVYMSDDATYDDAPDPSLQFQTGPEDSVYVRPIIADFSGFHIDAHFGTEEEVGFPGSNWWYNYDGKVISQDVRLRSAGIAPGFTEPVPTGDPDRQDGLVYGYPVHFLDHHNIAPWRDRTDNSPYYSQYSYNSPDQFTGAERLDTSLDEHDGPIEGSTSYGAGSVIEIPENGDGVTPNHMCSGGLNGPEIDSLILDKTTRLTQICYRFVSITNQDGLAKVKTNRVTNIQLGSVVYIDPADSFAYQGFHRVVSKVSDYEFTINVTYSSDDLNGFLYCKALEAHVTNSQTATVKVVRESNTSQMKAVIFRRSLDGVTSTKIGEVILTNELEKEISVTIDAEGMILVYTSTESLGYIKVTLPNNTLDLRGNLMWHGGDRTAPEITIIEPGEHFFDYNETGKSPFTEINNNKWWRGGRWRGSDLYTIENRDGLPGILSISSSPADFIVAEIGGSNYKIITATGDNIVAKLS